AIRTKPCGTGAALPHFRHRSLREFREQHPTRQRDSWEGKTMNFFRTILARRNEDGASAVEYGLLVAGIAALIVLVVFAFGGVIHDVFHNTCSSIGTSAGVSSTC